MYANAPLTPTGRGALCERTEKGCWSSWRRLSDHNIDLADSYRL